MVLNRTRVVQLLESYARVRCFRIVWKGDAHCRLKRIRVRVVKIRPGHPIGAVVGVNPFPRRGIIT